MPEKATLGVERWLEAAGENREYADFARQVNSSSRPSLTVGAVVSGLGQNLDVSA